jgi:putative heme-binding domain-containing protein
MLLNGRDLWRITGLLSAFWLGSLLDAAPLVVETDPLTPAEQQACFQLPPGFQIELIASEPEIGQPMNLSFDAQGRLWVTHSIEYPYPVAGEGVQPRDANFQGLGTPPARDRLSVITFDHRNRPQSLVHFAHGLNIPIGVIPLPRVAGEPTATIAFSIPHISRYTDADGDGVAEQITQLFGPFGNLDTHGMASSFTPGLDGWIYGCHGFRNDSLLAGSDGHTIRLNSGNTYRFRPDGSRIEQVTWGQVNPFGMTSDRWGNLYNADCHSMPLTCLLPGAYYQSFGKPHDGLGFGPDMIDHIHGSTGICGVAWYEAPEYPAEYQDCIFLCNPVNGIVHRDRITWRGSSPWVETQPDFITCTDGWFRPVDVKLGPDGALYIADFYNSIIGHYEVPLNHPRRDRTHGRIWRVTATGADHTAAGERGRITPDASVAELIKRLGHPNLHVRTQATLQLQHLPAVAELPLALAGSTSEQQRAHLLWVLVEQRALNREQWQRCLRDESELVRTHAARVLGAHPELDPERSALSRLLEDSSPMVRRAAAEAASRGVHPALLSPLWKQLQQAAANPADSHLLHMLKIAVRNHLRDLAPEQFPEFSMSALVAEQPQLASQLAVGVNNSRGAELAMEAVRQQGGQLAPNELFELLRQAARYGAAATLKEFVELRSQLVRPAADQLAEIQALRAGLQARGGVELGLLHSWGQSLAEQLLQQPESTVLNWTPLDLAGRPTRDVTFTVQQRASADGRQASDFFSSLPSGEQRTGIWQSDPFPLPEQLNFFFAGHDGFPDQPLGHKNLVRLRSAESGRVLIETSPPRIDLAQPIRWDLTEWAGESGFLELVDGDAAGAYAWIAVGRFSFSPLNPGTASPVLQAAELIASLKLTALKPQLTEVIRQEGVSYSTRLGAVQTLLRLEPDARRGMLLSTLSLPASKPWIAACLQVMADGWGPRGDELLAQAMQRASEAEQTRLARLLVEDAAGGAALLTLVDQGKASARLLLQPDLQQRLAALALPDLSARIAQLTADLPPQNEILATLIQQRQAVVESWQSHDPAAGQAVYRKHCAACHQFRGEGNKIGPQLDGVGQRGIARLLEDILDPNRNVDGAFRTSVIALTSGQVVTGLKRREEGATVIFANQEGKEFTVQANEIEEVRSSPLSLMPANLGEQIPPEQLAELVQYLRSMPPVTTTSE